MKQRLQPSVLRHKLREVFPWRWKDLIISVAILGVATLLCTLLRLWDKGDVFVALIFELAVVLVSRFTNGYLFGLLASLASVVGINYIFTYPYFAFNFTISGYPLTFLVMLAVSVAVSTLTTQIKQQEKLKAMAEKEKMRGNLLRAVSHDIRTPLTSIVGGVNAILDSGDQLPPQTQRELLQSIRAESQWLVSVVENLLSVTRMSGGASQITKVLEPGEEIMSSATVKFQKRFSPLAVTIHAPEELLMVPMDPILIEQVLLNLMENAAIHGGTTTAITLRLYQKGTVAVFEVSDNGNGIARDVLPRLFQGTLSHTSQRESDDKRNMGIGLSVCLSIIQAHGGALTGENLPGGGARFRFTLPMEETNHEDQRKGPGH